MEKQKFSLTKEIIRQINLQCDLRCFHEIFDKETIVRESELEFYPISRNQITIHLTLVKKETLWLFCENEWVKNCKLFLMYTHIFESSTNHH